MNFSDRSRILSFALAAFLLASPAENFARNEIRVDAVSGLTLSGYDKNDDLKWVIGATSAKLEEAGETKDVDAIKNGTWKIEGLEVKTFDNGNDAVTVTSRTALFFPKERRAEGKELVKVKDAANRFSVAGTGWFWKCDKKSDVNTIAVTDGVIVELYDSKSSADARNSAKTVKITAQCLNIELHDNETTLTFGSRNQTPVKVRQGDIDIVCDKLEVVIPQNAEEMDENTHRGNDSAEENSLQRIRKIAGSGNAVMKHDGREIRGDSVTLIPGENRFELYGNSEQNVVFEDLRKHLKISGNKAEGEIREITETGKKKLELSRIDIVGKEGKPVEVTTDSLEEKKNLNRRAKFSGQKLSVSFPKENETTICLEGKVAFKDATIELRCDKLEADTFREEETAGSSGKDKQLAALRQVRANGNVEARQDGMECRCEEAVIDARKELTILTGNPRVSVPAQNFSLSGNRCEIDQKNNVVFIESGDSRNPVRAEIKPEKTDKKTTLTGDSLKVSRCSENSEIAIFELSAKNDQKVRLDSQIENSDGKSEAIHVECNFLRTFYRAPKSKKKTKSAKNKVDFSALQKVEALGNVEIQKGEIHISGGKALMFNNVVVFEWIREDDDGSDGKNPMQIEVHPGDSEYAGPRPTIRFPQSAVKQISVPLLDAKSAKAKDSAQTKEILVEADELKTIVGERRIRFWLSGNVTFQMGDTEGECDKFEAKLLRPDSKAPFEPEAIFCRSSESRKVTIAQKAPSSGKNVASAGGNLLEIFPKKQIGFLSGNAYMQSEQFGRTTPGKSAGDRFILDLAKEEVRTEIDPKLLEGTPAQVARPRTMLPKDIRDKFENLKKHNKKDKK